MRHLVLARKWRPQTFQSLVGQSLTVKALTHALDTGKVHQAYLFTGTRGVGKTTVARIFAQGLLCETGISASPCGQCSHCKAIQQGRMIDFIEIDAASRTKVEDTRELLDNVNYPPSQARFKLYLIDEVHMLSGHSFNALLKTLEEPPEHVKFLLATTDPERLPATVLSRCLQCHLQAIPPELIAEQLRHILQEESVGFEPQAIDLLAQHAQGSLRDALSLLEQLIALAPTHITRTEAEKLLGVIPYQQHIDLLHAILHEDIAKSLDHARALLAQGIQADAIITQLQTAWHHIALAHCLNEPLPYALEDHPWTAQTKKCQEEHIQLLYEITTLGKKQLAYSPSPSMGLEMTLLRTISFQPSTPSLTSTSHATSPKSAAHGNPSSASQPKQSARATPVKQALTSKPAEDLSWHDRLKQLKLGSMSKALLSECQIIAQDENTIKLGFPHNKSHLFHDEFQKKATEAVHQQQNIRITFEAIADTTPAQSGQAIEQSATEKLAKNPEVNAWQQQFDGHITQVKLNAESDV